MIYGGRIGVPAFAYDEYAGKTKDYVVLIPVINEGERILKELYRAYKHNISDYADIVICDESFRSTRCLSRRTRAGRAPSCAWEFTGRFSGATGGSSR